MKDWFENDGEYIYEANNNQVIEGSKKNHHELNHNRNKKKSWRSYMTKDNMIILVLLGILLFIMALPTKKETNVTHNVEEQHRQEQVPQYNLEEKEEQNEISSYTQLEKRLENVLSYVYGVGNVKVMITLESSEEIVLEKDSPSIRSNTSENDKEGGNRTVSEMEIGEETVYIIDGDGNKQPIITKTMEPDIEGVVVIAEGGGNSQVQSDIIQIILSLFDVEVNKIKVVKMK